MNKFLNPAEAMQELGISYATLLRKVKSKEIPCVRVGASLRIPRLFIEKLEQDALSNVKEASHE